MLKKLIAMSLSLVMLFSASFTINAAEVESSSNDIISQALALNQDLGLNAEDVVVVSTNINSSTRTTTTGEQAIQAISTEDGLTTVTTIIPFKTTADGKLINSFEYEPVQKTRDYQMPIGLVDLTLTFTAHYENLSIPGMALYRHIGVDAVWNSSNSDLIVYNMHVKFKSTGDLHVYPDCKADYSTTLVQANYQIISEVNAVNPVKGTTYNDSDVMASDRVLYVYDPYHGANVSYTMIYKLDKDGDFYTADENVGYTIFDENRDYGTH